MKKTVTLFLICLLFACQKKEKAEIEELDYTKSWVKIISIKPVPGSVLEKNTILYPVVEYNISINELEKYGFDCTIFFRSDDMKFFKTGSYPITKQRHGIIDVEYQMKFSSIDMLSDPIWIQFLLRREYAKGLHEPLAFSDTLEYRK